MEWAVGVVVLGAIVVVALLLMAPRETPPKSHQGPCRVCRGWYATVRDFPDNWIALVACGEGHYALRQESLRQGAAFVDLATPAGEKLGLLPEDEATRLVTAIDLHGDSPPTADELSRRILEHAAGYRR